MPTEKPIEAEKKTQSSRAWILRVVFAAFIVGSIGAMFAADYFFAPDSARAPKPHDAVDD